jgi:hypothetical protein
LSNASSDSLASNFDKPEEKKTIMGFLSRTLSSRGKNKDKDSKVQQKSEEADIFAKSLDTSLLNDALSNLKVKNEKNSEKNNQKLMPIFLGGEENNYTTKSTEQEIERVSIEKSSNEDPVSGEAKQTGRLFTPAPPKVATPSCQLGRRPGVRRSRPASGNDTDDKNLIESISPLTPTPPPSADATTSSRVRLARAKRASKRESDIFEKDDVKGTIPV